MLLAVEFIDGFLQPARGLQGVHVKKRKRQGNKEQRDQHGYPRFLQDDLQVDLEDAEDGAEQPHCRAHGQHVNTDEAVSSTAAGVLPDNEAGDDGH